MTNLQRTQAGFMMMGTYLLVAALSTLSLAFFSRNFFFIQNTERNHNRVLAFNMADTGIDRTMRSIELNMNYAGTGSYSVLGSKGGYNTTVTTPANPMVRLIQSTGFAPSDDVNARAHETRSIDAYVQLDTTPFEFAAFGDDNLTLNGTPVVDSYNSSDGPYGGANTGSEGDVASDGDIELIGNPTVAGDQVQNPKINCVPASTSIPSQGQLKIQGNMDYQLPAGTYHFDSISISGNGKLTLLGPVVIYVDGEVYIGGNGVATSGNKPINFMLYATGEENIDIAGGGEFFGAVYAPASDVHYTGNSDLHGAVIAKTYQQSGSSELHYDEALKDIEAPCINVDLLSWRENGTFSQ
jgi:hypothetical protein